jgi:cytochrome c553
MPTKQKAGGKQYQSEASQMSQACVVIHQILGEASYDLNIGGLMRYSPPKGVKTALYALGLKPRHDAYISSAKVQQLDDAVKTLVENYEKLKMETGSKKRKPRKFADIIKEAYVKAASAGK